MVETVQIKTDETTAEKPAVEQTQEKILGKFDNQEDLVKSYQELEKKLGEQNIDQVETTDTSNKVSDNLEIKTAEEVVETAGLDMSTLQQQYDTNGTLDESAFEALEKAGIPKSYVDAFIQGQEAISNQIQSAIKSEVGGNDAYTELVSWAKDALNPNEIAAFNNVVNSNDLEAVKLAVTGLKARHDSINGVEPQLATGKSSASGTSGYDSWAQVTAAMKDTRYANDPAFRNEVQEKLNKSSI